MRRKRMMAVGCDALDVAVLWQSTPQTAGFPLLDIEESVRAANRCPDDAANHGMLKRFSSGAIHRTNCNHAGRI